MEGETFKEFSDLFYNFTQILFGLNFMTHFDSQIIINNAFKANFELNLAMLPELFNGYKTNKLVYYLKNCRQTFSFPKPKKNLKPF